CPQRLSCAGQRPKSSRRRSRLLRTRRSARGSFGHLCLTYYASATFKALDGSTQSWRRRADGAKPVSLMQGKHVRMLRDELADRRGAARNRLKALRALFRWAPPGGATTRQQNKKSKRSPPPPRGMVSAPSCGATNPIGLGFWPFFGANCASRFFCSLSGNAHG